MEKRDNNHLGEEQNRAILRQSSDPLPFSLNFEKPSQKLEKFFEYYWLVEWNIEEGKTHNQRVVTFPHPQLSFESEGAFLHGPLSSAYERQIKGSDRVIGIRFNIGALHPFIHSPISSITDKVLDAQTIFCFDITLLNQKIRKLDKLNLIAIEIENAFAPHLPKWDNQINIIQEWVGLCDTPRWNQPMTVSNLAKQAGCDIRTLQRKFKDYVGLSPKWILQRARLHDAISRIENDPEVELSQLSLELGYFDQAHMVRDFTKYVLSPPDRYRKQLTETKRPQATYSL